MNTSVVERFIRYAKIDTQSDHYSETFPSTAKQFNLAHLLFDELNALGLKDVSLDENCYIMATLPANTQGVPAIGFVAHMDTSPDLNGENVDPQFVDYAGGDIVLNHEKGYVLSPKEFPDLAKYTGQSLITTDGNTLLGADDKAGLAEIMAAMEYLVNHPEIRHGDIKIGFTPDEEVGQGADRFDVAKFNAKFAYTMDGGEVGELQYENFNAASAKLTVTGRNVHPGTSKDKMINAIQVAMDLHALLPAHQRPEHTDQYDGFYHLTVFEGSVESVVMRYIIREHDREKFEGMKKALQQAVDFTNQRFGKEIVHLEMENSYYNMKEQIKPVFEVIELADKAMRSLGITPIIVPIRGGTDGARLSYMGLPCPNIFTGGHYAHGRFEFIPVDSMEKAVAVIVKIAELAAQA